jgi:hypothetical protein
MFPIYPYATVFALFTNETRTVLLKDILLPSSPTEGKNSPSSRVNLECTSKPADKASIRQQAA